MATSTLPTSHIVSRVAASLLGSWLFVWGLSSLSIAGLAGLGVDYHEAQTFVMLLAFLVLRFAGRLWPPAWRVCGRCWAVAAWPCLWPPGRWPVRSPEPKLNPLHSGVLPCFPPSACR